MTFTRRGKLNLVLAALGLLTVVVSLFAELPLASRIAICVIALAVYAVLGHLLHRVIERDERTMKAIADGVASLRDSDYSVSVTPPDEAGPLRRLVEAYNGLGDKLRSQRQDIYQRELLLDTVIQATPLALLLTNANDTVIYGNLAARQVFHRGQKLEGLSLPVLLEQMPPAMRAAMSEDRDVLFTVDDHG